MPMPPHIIIMGMPLPIMVIICLQHCIITSFMAVSMGVISHVMPFAVMAQVILHIIIGIMGFIMVFVIGIMAGIAIGFMVLFLFVCSYKEILSFLPDLNKSKRLGLSIFLQGRGYAAHMLESVIKTFFFGVSAPSQKFRGGPHLEAFRKARPSIVAR
jgi:hypothetical protein